MSDIFLGKSADVGIVQVKIWSGWVEDEDKNKSWRSRSFQPGNSSVDGETQNGNHGGAQRHPQPERGTAHVRTIEMSTIEQKKVTDTGDISLALIRPYVKNTYGYIAAQPSLL